MPRIFKIDLVTEELVRDKNGFCIECAAGEPGELLGRVLPIPGKPSGNWDGYYKNPEATNKKIVTGILAPGDKWCRTGDLIVRDWRGWIYCGCLIARRIVVNLGFTDLIITRTSTFSWNASCRPYRRYVQVI